MFPQNCLAGKAAHIVRGLGFRVQGVGLGLRVPGNDTGFRIHGSWSRFHGLGFLVQGLWFDIL